MLRHTQNIPIRILEPAHLVPRRKGADLRILHKRILLRRNPTLLKPTHHLLNLRYFPPQHGPLRRRKIRHFGHSDRICTTPHHQSILILADKLKSKFVRKECLCLVIVGSKEKPNHLRRSQHSSLPGIPSPEEIALDRISFSRYCDK